MVETTTCPEVATIYAQFPWLEKVHPQTKTDCVHIRDLKDIGVKAVRNASAYAVQANGDFAEIDQRVVKEYLWPEKCVFFDTYKEPDIASAIQQANSSAYIVVVQNRCLTVFCNV